MLLYHGRHAYMCHQHYLVKPNPGHSNHYTFDLPVKDTMFLPKCSTFHTSNLSLYCIQGSSLVQGGFSFDGLWYGPHWMRRAAGL